MTAVEFETHIKKNNPKIAKYVRMKKIKKLLLLLFLDALIIGTAVMTQVGMSDRDMRLPLCLVALVGCVLVSFYVGTKKLLFGKNHIGQIQRCYLEARYVESRNNIRAHTTQVFFIIDVKVENEKIVQIQLDKRYQDCYKEGDTVVLYNGIRYPFLINPPRDRQTICWWCGSIKRAEYETCIACQRSYLSV